MAASSLLIWAISGSAITALILTMAADFIGALPTMRKLLQDPGSESRTAWMIIIASNVVNVLAIETWTLEIALFPIYFIFVNATILSLSLRKAPR
jgi:hypothetical protein